MTQKQKKNSDWSYSIAQIKWSWEQSLPNHGLFGYQDIHYINLIMIFVTNEYSIGFLIFYGGGMMFVVNIVSNIIIWIATWNYDNNLTF